MSVHWGGRGPGHTGRKQTLTAAVTPSTWNPADKGSLTVLSNGNLTAATPGGGWYGARNVHSAAGKRYCEMVLTVASTGVYGIANATAAVEAVYHAATTNGVGYYAANGQILYGGAVLATYSIPANGDILGIHHDEIADLIWFRLNGVALAGDPAAGTGGLSVPGIGATPFACFTSTDIATVTIRTTTAEFRDQPASGFTAWKSS